MKLAWTGAALAAMATAGLLEKSAIAADVPLAVLGIEATEAPDALAASLTDALRQRVTATKGFRLVPGRDLVEVKLVFSCPDEAPSCMAQAGKSLGASKLIFGSVKKSIGDSFLVTLKLLDANRGIVDAFVAEQISKAQSTGPAIRGPVQKWFNTLTGQGGGGIVKVRSDVMGAAIALDGNPSGTMGTDDFLLPGITPGKHEIVLTKTGYEPAHKEITVTSGDNAPVEIKMTRSPSVAPPAAPPLVTGPRPIEPQPTTADTGGGNTLLKTTTWAVFGAGIVSVALGVKYGTDVQSINNDLDEFRRFSCGPPELHQVCDTKGQVKPGLNAAQVAYVKAKKEDGQRLELYQYVSYGVGGALLLTSGYLFYRAYVAEPETRASNGRRLAVLPLLSPTEAGAAAVVQF